MIDLKIENRLAVLTLNRPEKRNALNDVMASEIRNKLEILREDDACKVLLIKANGDAFCAGADLGYLQKLQDYSYEENLKDSLNLMEMFRALNEFPKITISQVEGPAFAGGCGLATLCDFCFAAPEAKFAYTEVKIGFIPAIVSVFLSAGIGEHAARRMLLTGEILDAEEALKTGLITRVVSAGMIGSEVENFASNIIRNVSEESIARTKKLLRDIKGHPQREQLMMAAEANADARGTEDCKKGISAFLNKERLSW